MGCERIDYSSEDEYQQALIAEREAWGYSQQVEPDVVPCFKCGCQMYWESSIPEENVCQNCRNHTWAGCPSGCFWPG
jgi:hypothetical protein